MRADYAVAYVATVIESPQDRDIVIALAVDDNMKIWLNHELLVADPNNALNWIKKYQHLIGARLKKGSNLLVVKVCNLTKDWRLIVNLYPREHALTLAQENGVNPILKSAVVAAGHPLELRADLLTQSASARLEVVGQAVSPADLSKLPPNHLYYCRLSGGGLQPARGFSQAEAPPSAPKPSSAPSTTATQTPATSACPTRPSASSPPTPRWPSISKRSSPASSTS
jgi:hypothetical protein